MCRLESVRFRVFEGWTASLISFFPWWNQGKQGVNISYTRRELLRRARQAGEPGSGHRVPHRSLLVMAVEKRSVDADKSIKGLGFLAGGVRLAVLPAATQDQPAGFVGASTPMPQAPPR